MRSLQLLARPRIRVELLTIAVAVSLIGVAWQTLSRHDRKHIERLVHLGAISIQADIVTDMQERLRGQTRLAQLWEIASDPGKKDWESSAKLYMDHYPGTLLMEWVASSNRQHWIFPRPAASTAEVLDRVAAAEREQAIQSAVAQRRLVMTRAIHLPSGERVVMAVAPVFFEHEVAGVIISAFDVSKAMRAMLEDVSHLGYEFVLLEQGNEIYALHEEYREHQAEGIHTELAIPDFGWTVRVWPGPELMDDMKSAVPEIVAAAMASLAVAVLLTLHLAALARRRTRLAQAINENLVREVADRRRAEELARVSEAKFAGILNGSADAIISVDSDHRIVLFNQGAERIFGYRAEEVLSKSLDILLPSAARAMHRAQVAQFAQSTVTTMRMCDRRPVSGVRKDGVEFPAEATVSKLQINGEVTFTAILRDVTERVRAEEALREARNELENRVRERTAELAEANVSLRQLSGRLLASQEDERRRIARELHDSTSQTLVVAMMNLEKLQLSSVAGQEPASEVLSECIRLVEAAAGELRTVSYRLHPPMLEEFGLPFSLGWYVNGFGKRMGISIDINVGPELGRLERDVEMTVFRIVQEALTNVQRHSHATHAKITLTRGADALRLEIADNGKGMSPDMLSGQDMNLMGVGIAGMRQRVYQLGGKWEIRSGTDGTTITAVFPIREDKSSALTPHGFST